MSHEASSIKHPVSSIKSLGGTKVTIRFPPLGEVGWGAGRERQGHSGFVRVISFDAFWIHLGTLRLPVCLWAAWSIDLGADEWVGGSRPPHPLLFKSAFRLP
jgi:hypothetical protein